MKHHSYIWSLKRIVLLVVSAVLAASLLTSEVLAVDRVTIQLDWKTGSEHAFLYLGKQKGFFKSAGIDLAIVPGKGSSDSVNMVDAGNVQFALASGESVVQGRCATPQRRVTALAVFFPTTPTTIYSLAQKGIKKPTDLYGKKVGVMKGSSAYKHYLAFLRKQHLDAGRITEIPTTGSLQEVIAPNSELDAMVHFSYQQPLQLELDGRRVNEIPLRKYGVKVYGTGLIAGDELIKSKPALVGRVTRAILRSEQYAIDHPKEANRLFLKLFPEQEPRYSEAKLKWVNVFINSGRQKGKPLGYSDIKGWQSTMDYLYDQKLVDRRVDVRQVFTTRFLK